MSAGGGGAVVVLSLEHAAIERKRKTEADLRCIEGSVRGSTLTGVRRLTSFYVNSAIYPD